MIRSLILALILSAASAGSRGQARIRPLRVGVVGLVHGHVAGFLAQARGRGDIQLVGIAEPNRLVLEKYARQLKLDRGLLFSRAAEMLDRCRPQAVVIYTSTYDHGSVVALCAARHIDVMMEKPLAVSVEQGRAIAAAASQGHIHVLVNYETTWYPTNQLVRSVVKDRKLLGEVRKVVIRDGHEGPREIGCQAEFLAWLTDPKLNGAGALYDFGCYGANLMTWLMDNRRPLSVFALAQHMKPQTYPHVDDDATIVLEYPAAQAVIQASWNWPFGRKDWDIYCSRGYLSSVNRERVRYRASGDAEESVRAPDWPSPYGDSISYLVAVARGEIHPSGPSSLENNLIVTEILDAARTSARTGRKVILSPSSTGRRAAASR